MTRITWDAILHNFYRYEQDNSHQQLMACEKFKTFGKALEYARSICDKHKCDVMFYPTTKVSDAEYAYYLGPDQENI